MELIYALLAVGAISIGVISTIRGLAGIGRSISMNRYLAVFLPLFLYIAFAQSQQTTPTQTCPVGIKKIVDGSYGSINRVTLAAELGLSSPSRGHVGIDYTNRSDKDLLSVRFGVAYINSMREVAYEDLVTTKEHRVKPGKTFGLIAPNGYITGGDKSRMAAWG
jgi:hypothetical protein